MESTGSTAEQYRRFRRQRLTHRLGRWRKLWQVYYRSPYGKAGFWILVAFAAVAVLSPVLTLHNPYTFFAPSEDTTIADPELARALPYSVTTNGSPLAPTTAAVVPAGSYVIFTTAENGSISAVAIGGSATTPAGKIFAIQDLHYPANAQVFAATSFPLASYETFTSASTFLYSEYLLEGASWNGTSHLGLSEVKWTGAGNQPGAGSPEAVSPASATLSGTLVTAPVSDSIAVTSLPVWGPFDSSQASAAGLKPGYVYAETELAGQYQLTELYTVPFEKVWTVTLPGSGLPTAPVFVGSFFSYSETNDTEVLVAQNDTLYAYAPLNGTLLWQANLTGPVNPSVAPVIPSAYQISYANSNLAFLALGGSAPAVVAVNLQTASVQLVTPLPAPVVGIATSAGETGYPSSVTVTTASRAYFLNSPTAVAGPSNAIAAPAGFGSFVYDPTYDDAGNLMVLTGSTGDSIAVTATLGTDPIQWRATLSPAATAVSAPVIFLNPASGKNVFAFTTSGNRLEAFATTGTDENPLPPTLKSPSGNVYLFGTNTYGNDLWSQWVASFAWDWEIGLAVALGIMAIAVLVAMFIGYVSNWVATVVETVTLVLFLLPGLALLIVVAAILGASFLNIILVLTFVGWPFTAFTLIGVVRQVKARTFVEAARVSGARTMQILRRHMLPNMTPLLAYFTALSVGGAATALSTLQFLGVAPLTIPTWGGMLQPMFGNYYLLVRAPWWVWPPTIALTMFVFAFVFVSRGLDEVVNPRIRPR